MNKKHKIIRRDTYPIEVSMQPTQPTKGFDVSGDIVVIETDGHTWFISANIYTNMTDMVVYRQSIEFGSEYGQSKPSFPVITIEEDIIKSLNISIDTLTGYITDHTIETIYRYMLIGNL